MESFGSADSSSSASSYNTKTTTIATSTMSAPNHRSTPHYQPTKGTVITPRFEDYDLDAPLDVRENFLSAEILSELLFCKEHLESIFGNASLLLKFTTFLSVYRPDSIPTLLYYLDARKALRAIAYANTVAHKLESLPGLAFSESQPSPLNFSELAEKAQKAFEVMIAEDLPAYVTHLYVHAVKTNLSKPSALGAQSLSTVPPSQGGPEGLAEVFCVTEPSRPDNPIVFVSEAFHWMTQYGLNYCIGRNCRFLQGPRTNRASISRLRNSVESGTEHCELVLNYRRDGSPFLNLLMHAPLCDNSGNVRYYLGAQVDVTDVFSRGKELPSLQRLLKKQRLSAQNGDVATEDKERVNAFEQLSETFDTEELQSVCTWAGRILKGDGKDADRQVDHKWKRPGVLLREPSADLLEGGIPSNLSAKLHSFYQYYMLVRPSPSFQILFASPALRIPGLVPSPILDRIGGSSHVKNELEQALEEGRGVTARIRWISRAGREGRSRWIHFTPLLRSDGQIGVWVAVLVDDEEDTEAKGKSGIVASPDIRIGKPTVPQPVLQQNIARPDKVEHKPKISWSGPEVDPETRRASLHWMTQPGRDDAFSVKTVSTSDGEEEAFESLEQRLQRRRAQDAAQMTENAADIPIRTTYKSLNPYGFLTKS